MAGTHADVRRVIPEGLSIGVDEMRAIVQTASRRPGTGRWQIVVVEDADRLTEGAANALLKVVEEPPPSTVFLLCAPSVDPEDIAVTLRSRCRHVALTTPRVDAIAQVLVENDGLSEADARWAASVSGGAVGGASGEGCIAGGGKGGSASILQEAGRRGQWRDVGLGQGAVAEMAGWGCQKATQVACRNAERMDLQM